MKKIIGIIGGVLGGIIILLIIFVSYFLISVRDKTNNTIDSVIENNYTAEEVFSREMTYALCYSDRMELEIDEMDLTEIIYGAVKDLKISGVKVKGAYVKYEGESYLVEIPVEAYSVPSCIKCKIHIDLSHENGVQIEIEDFKMGKFDADSFFVRKFVLNQSTKNKLAKNLEKKGIELTIGKDLSISMNETQIINTLNSVCDTEDASLFVLITRLALETDLVDFNVKEGAIGFRLMTDELLYNPSIHGEIDTFVAFDKAVSKVRSSGCASKEIGTVFSYYVQGYDALSDKKKAVIDELGYSKLESGVKNEGTSILKLIIAHSPSVLETLQNKGFTIAFNDKEVNSLFEALPFIGAGTAFTDGERIAYIAVDALAFTLKDKALEINFVLSLNGKRICISASALAEDSTSLSLSANVKKLSVGSVTLDEKFIGYVLQYLDSILKEQNWIYTNGTDSLILDFEESIKESNILSLLVSDNVKRYVIIRDNSLEIIFKI